ncbi:MAG: hypothetical protein K0R26_194 [Bacteroidota bacterium]|jgi:hypothetical protein|nr:hypothetical protein [Bacteroidota bacterium]
MISIQKQVLLLSDFHFKEFSDYLLNTNADLPYKLINTIRFSKRPHESDELCQLIYGDSAEKTKRKFLQLTHHTFKLSGFLSRNYTNYLKHNLQIIEELLSKGEKKKANDVAEWLYDVAEKIEDYTTLIEVTKFFAQQSFITESKDANKYHKKVDEYIEYERIKNAIYLYLRENLFFKGKENISKAQANKDLAFFNQYTEHKSNSINLLARFGKYYELSFLSHPDFFKQETLKSLDELERDFLNNAHVCFHYLDDMYFKILGLRLQLNVNNNNTDSMLQEVKKMNNISSFLKFWSSYINIPEIFSFSVQASHYMSSYAFIFRQDYHSTLPGDIKENILYLKQKLESELSKNCWNDGEYIIKLINLKCFYAAVLLTGDDNDKAKSVKILEDTLVSYQQIPFQKFLDGMFSTLIMGYFSLQQYDKVISTYKRYKKITSDQIVVKENDLTIDAYYFTSQYLTNQRKQYTEKLKSTYNESDNFDHIKNLISELGNYYKIPVSF